MPFEIVRNDIVNMRVDAIVNTTNCDPVVGCGVDSGIHLKAGPKLMEARKQLGVIPVGCAAVTPGYDMNARFVIHTVCPVWEGGTAGEEALLRCSYIRCMELAVRRRCRTVAFPLMGAGNNGFPTPLAIRIAIDAIRDFLMEKELHISLVVFSRNAWELSGKLFDGLSSFIDEHYVQEKSHAQLKSAYPFPLRRNRPAPASEEEFTLYRREDPAQTRREELLRERTFDADFVSEPDADDCCMEKSRSICHDIPCAPSAPELREQEPRRKKASVLPKRSSHPAEPGLSLEKLLEQTDAGFSETLLKLIDKTGKKDSEIYTKANVSRQHFSKIRKNPAYRPTKATAIAFAIALELDLEQTKDLIGRAGFALTNSSKFDVIIMYFIQEENYDLYEINSVLFRYDQSLLGA